MTDKQVLVSRGEAAQMLGVSIDTTARLIANGDLAVVRIGRSVLIPATEIAALVDRGGAATKSETNPV